MKEINKNCNNNTMEERQKLCPKCIHLDKTYLGNIYPYYATYEEKESSYE